MPSVIDSMLQRAVCGCDRCCGLAGPPFVLLVLVCVTFISRCGECFCWCYWGLVLPCSTAADRVNAGGVLAVELPAFLSRLSGQLGS